MSQEEMPPLGETWRDRAVSLAKGGVGLIPVAGGILAELVSVVIPNQRMDRLEDYVRRLNERLSAEDEAAARERMSGPEAIDLFEDGAAQAVRALSDERKAYIASIVATGLSGDERERLEAKRLLSLLREIDDDQVIILTSHLHRHWDDDEFHERHAAVLEPRMAFIGSSQEEIDAETLHETSRMHLVRLGLLRPSFGKPRKGEVPEFDEKTGMLKASGYELTSLGRMLLRRIELAEPDEF